LQFSERCAADRRREVIERSVSAHESGNACFDARHHLFFCVVDRHRDNRERRRDTFDIANDRSAVFGHQINELVLCSQGEHSRVSVANRNSS
jgi:hypothetical protein